jgi:hypothetical protein
MSCIGRRRFLVCSLTLPAAVFVASTATGQCVDPDELSDSAQGMRETVEYTDESPDPKRICNGCAYFKPVKADAACAHCEVLGSPVSAKGHCESWTKRS